ncbi:hypothetical protein HW115_18675 [Verrucomicrobiaceae bacterium N1E253]|uniref:Uncharacterized protein n=1 Tax=Oceaniferula marina TaxID=2748318 RepID=A0A851GKI0_9BACT|nr:hypothetical protein [Oceaniferula marina]NWK57649.1 hypothetical protein [Oceaniferula marina]
MKTLPNIALMLFSSFYVYSNDEGLTALKTHAAVKKITAENIKNGISTAVWNAEKSAVVACFRGREATLCLVAYKNGDSYSISDVSKVESYNFGKLGFRRSHYSRFLTEPIKWKEDEAGFTYQGFGAAAKYEIYFRTRAWTKGQRYTVGEPLVLTASWKPLWR